MYYLRNIYHLVNLSTSREIQLQNLSETLYVCFLTQLYMVYSGFFFSKNQLIFTSFFLLLKLRPGGWGGLPQASKTEKTVFRWNVQFFVQWLISHMVILSIIISWSLSSIRSITYKKRHENKLLRSVTTDQSRYSLNGFEGKAILASHYYQCKKLIPITFISYWCIFKCFFVRNLVHFLMSLACYEDFNVSKCALFVAHIS